MPQGSEGEAGRPSVLLLVIAGTALGFAESLLPRPLPFLKPGFANIAGVLAAITMGTRGALRVNATRCLAVALATGTLATPSFVLSMSSALSSALMMGSCSRLVPGRLSITALSVAGSAAGMAAQLIAACAILPGLPVRALLPPAAAWAVFSGAIVGIASASLMRSGVMARLQGGLVREPGQE